METGVSHSFLFTSFRVLKDLGFFHSVYESGSRLERIGEKDVSPVCNLHLTNLHRCPRPDSECGLGTIIYRKEVFIGVQWCREGCCESLDYPEIIVSRD